MKYICPHCGHSLLRNYRGFCRVAGKSFVPKPVATEQKKAKLRAELAELERGE